jgi:hypothetical protein
MFGLNSMLGIPGSVAGAVTGGGGRGGTSTGGSILDLWRKPATTTGSLRMAGGYTPAEQRTLSAPPGSPDNPMMRLHHGGITSGYGTEWGPMVRGQASDYADGVVPDIPPGPWNGGDLPADIGYGGGPNPEMGGTTGQPTQLPAPTTGGVWGTIASGGANRLPPGGYDVSGFMAPTTTQQQPGGASGVYTGPGTGYGGSGYGGGFMPPTAQQALDDDPGYAFRQQQGQQAIERSAAARGTLLTGGTAKALQNYAQGLASQEYGNVYGRRLGEYRNYTGDMFNLANMGLSAAGAGAGANSSYGNAGSELITGMGNADAAGQVGSANAWNNAMGNIGNSTMDAIMLHQMLRRPPAPPTTPPYVPGAADWFDPSMGNWGGYGGGG